MRLFRRSTRRKVFRRRPRDENWHPRWFERRVLAYLLQAERKWHDRTLEKEVPGGLCRSFFGTGYMTSGRTSSSKDAEVLLMVDLLGENVHQRAAPTGSSTTAGLSYPLKTSCRPSRKPTSTLPRHLLNNPCWRVSAGEHAPVFPRHLWRGNHEPYRPTTKIWKPTRR